MVLQAAEIQGPQAPRGLCGAQLALLLLTAIAGDEDSYPNQLEIQLDIHFIYNKSKLSSSFYCV